MKNETVVVPVILAGGSGTRLWPLSRQTYPKQFISLVDAERTMFQETVVRAMQVAGAEAPVIVCSEVHKFIVTEQLNDLGVSGYQIILEPTGRDTAPAITLAALSIKQRHDDAVMLVMPADHHIKQSADFVASVQTALAYSDKHLALFGIRPTHPATGYGYIRTGSELADKVAEVSEFVEKPDAARAQEYLDAGNYYWNSGIFVLNADLFLEEIRELSPEIHDTCVEACSFDEADQTVVTVDKEIFESCPAISVDYAVMEKTRKAIIVELSSDWNDVGVWASLLETGTSDDAGNVTRGDVILKNVKNSYVRAESKLVAAVGVDDHVIIETKDAILVTHRGHSQDVKSIVNELKRDNRDEAMNHVKVYRPWGSYESICASSRFQVKRIIVNPGACLSLQMHHHRAEHWVVVKGVAKVTNGETEMLLSEDQSTYIPLGHLHRLENPGKIPLELIEVQTGAYLGEDDIVRFEDVYGRAEGK